jgi:DNA-binding transcriptional ArsR family regulator
MLLSLLDGRALPAGELAFSANVAPQTASGHLAKLVEGGLLSVETQGRHRYYRLAGPHVGTALEALGELAPAPRVRDREPEEVRVLRFARTCYNHLAGRLAVDINCAMQRRELLAPFSEKQCELTEAGRKWLAEITREHTLKLSRREGVARLCLDWTERQHHLGGPLGCTLLNCLCEAKWIVRLRGRAVRLTVDGRIELGKQLGLAL